MCNSNQLENRQLKQTDVCKFINTLKQKEISFSAQHSENKKYLFIFLLVLLTGSIY